MGVSPRLGSAPVPLLTSMAQPEPGPPSPVNARAGGWDQAGTAQRGGGRVPAAGKHLFPLCHLLLCFLLLFLQLLEGLLLLLNQAVHIDATLQDNVPHHHPGASSRDMEGGGIYSFVPSSSGPRRTAPHWQSRGWRRSGRSSHQGSPVPEGDGEVIPQGWSPCSPSLPPQLAPLPFPSK